MPLITLVASCDTDTKFMVLHDKNIIVYLFTVILETSFHRHHTVAASSGPRENTKLNNIYRILSKDGATEIGGARGIGMHRY